MYFFKKSGKQHLDFRGNFILSHNVKLIRTRAPSNAPRRNGNARYIENIPNLTRAQKIRATYLAVCFIWTKKSQAIDAAVISKENGLSEGVNRLPEEVKCKNLH